MYANRSVIILIQVSLATEGGINLKDTFQSSAYPTTLYQGLRTMQCPTTVLDVTFGKHALQDGHQESNYT